MENLVAPYIGQRPWAKERLTLQKARSANCSAN
jgi:hypothetical protein